MIEKLNDFNSLREWLGGKDETIGFVPTMGALHDGHIRLVEEALKTCDCVIVSIFVNPKQFAPHEDLATYPRQLEQDLERLEKVGAHAVYSPDEKEFYPQGFSTRISVGQVTTPLEGVFRPHFFDGVTTVVAKLFFEVMPDKAFFGEKDYQQLQTIRKMVKDMRFPVEIIGVPTVRDTNSGLALSSRNAYLNPAQLEIAGQLNLVLLTMAEKIDQGIGIPDVESWGKAELLIRGFTKVDYCDIRDADTLEPAKSTTKEKRILAAAYIDKTRLIDNISA